MSKTPKGVSSYSNIYASKKKTTINEEPTSIKKAKKVPSYLQPTATSQK